ncbi:MAG: hypothetical protein KAS64_07130 [Spirochaetes bacterium]|nr:hypothetical protein [Spirochaetota bacterium]
MKYDKKSINAVKKQGVFDSSMDSEVLGMEDFEKEELSHKIKDNVKQFPEDTALPSGDANRQAKNKKKTIESLNLWDRVVFVIRKFFYGESIDTFIKNIEIKKLQRKVSHFNPRLYNIRSGRVSVKFCELINILAGQVLEIKKVFEVCEKPDLQARDTLGSFEEFYLWQHMEDIPNFSEKFNHEYIKKYNTLFHVNRVRETVEKEIDAYFNTITSNMRHVINYSYANLLGIERLSEFNYFGFFKKFDGNFNVFNDGFLKNSQFSFKPVPGDEIIFELKRIEGLLYSIDLDTDLDTPFNILFKYFSMAGGQEEEAVQLDEERINARVQALLTSIKSMIQDEKLTSFIKLIMKNPDRLPEIKIRKVNVIEKVRLILIDKYINHCNTVVNQMEIIDLNKQVKLLFEGEPLSFLEFYNDATNRKLIGLELPVFIHFKQIQILKTFGEKRFTPVIKPAMSIFLVDGDFIDKRMYQYLADFFYNYNLVDRQILDFENSISSKTSDGEKLQNALNIYSGDIVAKKYLSEKIGYLNHMAAKIIRDFLTLFQNTLPAFKAIMKDASSDKRHELIDNIRTLGGSKNKKILFALSQAERSVGIICDMLESYGK